MIISNIIGGLGNQMFQYAAARALSIRYQVPLKLDVRGFDNYSLHQGFELQRVFTAPITLATDEEMHRTLGWQLNPILRRIAAFPAMKFMRRKSLVVEPYFNYWPGINDVPPECYLVGYWQSEHYFSSAEDSIRGDFTFRETLSGHNSELVELIAACNAVSLHIRRGDYVTHAKSSSIHGACSLDYYHDAISHISKHVSSPRIFIFSDDMEWVRGNLHLDFPCVFIDHNRGGDSYRDMQLMSLCRHHIIANSSFSWWGAWLNPRPDKIVVAPERWFIGDLNASDLIPQTWVKI